MSDPELRFQMLLNKLKTRGSRLTSHRLALLRLLAASERHPSAAQLYKQLRIQFPTISLATIYKTLALLKEEGEVLEINLNSDRHYDGNKPYPHPHLVCNQCGQILDADEVDYLTTIKEEIRTNYEFQVVHSQLLFFGLCSQCDNSSP